MNTSLLTPILPSEAPPGTRRVEGTAAHTIRWLHLPGVSGALNLCLVRDIFFGFNLDTQTPSCQIVMAYNDLSGWPVTHTIDDPAVMSGLRDLRARESVWMRASPP